VYQASTSLFTGCTFSLNLNIFHEYLVQQSLKLGGTNYHFKWVNVPGTASYLYRMAAILELGMG
jgi:hypothetical protein